MYLYRFMQSWSAAKDVLAQGTTEADITQIPLGTTATIKWSGTPVFVSHRTEACIAAADNCDWESLRKILVKDRPMRKMGKCPFCFLFFGSHFLKMDNFYVVTIFRTFLSHRFV